MKIKLIIVSVIAVMILVTIGAFIILRGDEDNWICENGAWMKHGNPKEPMPKTFCGSASEKKADNQENIPPNSVNEENSELIGGEKDEHGCLVPAGYSWCEKKQKCLRAWEEECSADEKENIPEPAPIPKPLPLPPPDSSSKPAPPPDSKSTPLEDMPAPLPLP